MFPLTIPELLDQCLHHLLYQPNALLACALVHRSWIFPAQSTLYWHVLLASYPGVHDPRKLNRRCSLLLRTLRSSPHLASLIRSLELYPEGLSTENLTALLNTRLPMLHTLYLAYITPSDLVVTGMKQLLSRPSLNHVQIHCLVGASEDIFQCLFASLAPTVTQLEFFPGNMCPLAKETPTAVYQGVPLQIESFRFTGAHSACVQWLESAVGHYLDFSHLRRLSMGFHYHFLHTPLFLAAASTIEALKLDTRQFTGIVHISAYTRLENLSISCGENDDLWTVARILESISPSTCLIPETFPALFDVLEVQLVEAVWT